MEAENREQIIFWEELNWFLVSVDSKVFTVHDSCDTF